MDIYRITCFLITWLSFADARPSCPVGFFRNATSSSHRHGCVPCSACSSNTIVRKPCSRTSDTVCGLFYEFDFLKSSDKNKPEVRSYGKVQKLYPDPNWQSIFGLENGGPIGSGDGMNTDEPAPPLPGVKIHRLSFGVASNVSKDDSSSSSSSSSEDELQSISNCTATCLQRLLCFTLIISVVSVCSLLLVVYCATIIYFRHVNSRPIMPPEIRIIPNSGDGHPESASPGRSSGDGTPRVAGRMATYALTVDSRVRHLEEQLYKNQRRRAFLRWIFGSTSASERVFCSNDYMDERHRQWMIRRGRNDRGSDGEALVMQTYPGMAHVPQLMVADDGGPRTGWMSSAGRTGPDEPMDEDDQSMLIRSSLPCLPHTTSHALATSRASSHPSQTTDEPVQL